mmetsp:Transcript_24087/g.42886  ORF Transcript_24087/g.42886 Transcript_24087/m.42886 type:complete len:263 (-) Transcript_24087:25-813(-)
MVFRRGHQFPASPLAAAVPLDGSDTVPGLRQLERTVPAEAQRAAFHRSRRYGGPHLEQLTTDHLTAAPKPWKEFFEGASGWSGAYVVPASWFDLWDRAEENIVRFLPNYLRVLMVCLACVLYMTPLAAVGLVLMFLIWDYMRTYTAARHIDEQSWEYRAIYIAANLTMWVVALKSRGMLVISRGAFLAAAVIFLHSAGKVAPSELRTPRSLFARRPRRPDGGDWLANLCALSGVTQAVGWLEWKARALRSDAADWLTRLRQR